MEVAAVSSLSVEGVSVAVVVVALLVDVVSASNSVEDVSSDVAVVDGVLSDEEVVSSSDEVVVVVVAVVDAVELELPLLPSSGMQSSVQRQRVIAVSSNVKDIPTP